MKCTVSGWGRPVSGAANKPDTLNEVSTQQFNLMFDLILFLTFFNFANLQFINFLQLKIG